jgi:hypothetical protein
MAVPYPPGIPILMPGARAGEADGPVVKYLLALQELDRKCPGFAQDIHGVERSPTAPFASNASPTPNRPGPTAGAQGAPEESFARWARVLGSGSPLGSSGQPGRRLPVVIACREREQ